MEDDMMSDLEIWKTVQEAGRGEGEPWGFTWGGENIEDLRKGLATVMKPEFIDLWLSQPSEGFPETPQKVIEDGGYEQIWLMIYEYAVGIST